MGERPASPARFLKPHYIAAALIPVIIVLLSVTGFVWAHKGITLVVDGDSRYIKTQAEDVAGLLDEADVVIGEGDVVTPAGDASLQDGMSVVVCHAVPVTLSLSGDRIRLYVVGQTVADALVAAGVDAGTGTVADPPLETPLTPNMLITVNDVFLRVVQEEVEIPFETVTERDASQPQGAREVITQGVPGRMLRIYRVVVTDGVEGARTLTAERVLIKPVDEVVAVGIKRSSGRLTISRGKSRPPSSGEKISVVSTAYAPGVDGVDWRTATGARAGYGVIAVDPSVIPLGTHVYVSGYGYAVAADTGGSIRGNRIDVCFDTRAEAIAWGRRTVTVTILP
ncbi:MAG: 3D domain-containing protein [Actinomycetota bacterium]|nr:3D domain-containing protein [Actinomycetota bacterium]